MTSRQKPAPSRNGYSYKPRFGIIVMCDDEADQRAKYEALRSVGYRLKVVTV